MQDLKQRLNRFVKMMIPSVVGAIAIAGLPSAPALAEAIPQHIINDIASYEGSAQRFFRTGHDQFEVEIQRLLSGTLTNPPALSIQPDVLEQQETIQQQELPLEDFMQETETLDPPANIHKGS